jgi:eukaryotic-like serine/threonine-protein kinase
MSCLIPGYEYDIFISYRQKDNKIDGWVTEFVEHLQGELEATFKDEVSVYFDINPHDGLLETHDVDASLEEKLKCLIFIPVISRTYCDPRSFAWDHEFRAFVEQASHDRFGLKIKLPNGNVASRVLPVRIHDLNAEDVKLCESIIGGYLRGVDFIYKSAGVNRPLRAHEDHPHDNLNKTFYRDQINKVANAIDEIITALRKDQSKPPHEGKAEIPDKKLIIENTYPEKKPKNPEKETKRNWRIWTLTAIAFVLLLCGGILINHRVRVRWARTIALPKIEQLLNDFEFKAAFELAQKNEKYISEDPQFRLMQTRIYKKLTIITEPPGADIYIKSYSSPADNWEKIGKTPIDSMCFPRFTYYQVKFAKEGYDTLLGAMATPFGNPGIKTDTISRKLFRKGTLPAGMVYVEGYWDEVSNHFAKECGFFIDRYEVTNRQFKDFMDKGGYENPAYWKNEFVNEGKKLTREEALSLFVDKTGRPGPSTWEAGDYPEGQEDYPVSGISWYEAAAYAEFAGKSLPTADHWDSGAGFYYKMFYNYIRPQITPISNFNGKGLVPVGKQTGITPYGAFDMAGNVREWCWNETGKGHIISGGGYDDANYLYTQWSQLPSFDRSVMNGFRCALYIEKDKIPNTAFRSIDLTERTTDFTGLKPVSDEIFAIYRNQFLYDSIPLNAKVLYHDQNQEEWEIEKVSMTAAYGNETLITYLFLPKNATPPYQTLILFPGTYAQEEKNLLNSNGTKWLCDYIVKSGRAIIYPVYKGTFERNDGKDYPSGEHQYKELLIQWVKDFSRTLDYLETRPDIDMNKLCYYGFSWGGNLGGIIPAVEERLKLSVLILGGFVDANSLPEANELNYISHVKIPVLMLNGRYDDVFEINRNVKYFYKLLGSPMKDKRLCVYETGHYVSKSNMIRETLAWLDKYFGPVNHLEK